MARTAKVTTLGKASASGKGYTKSQLINHLIGAVEKAKLGSLSRKQVAALIDAYAAVAIDYAKSKSGGLVVGVGKVKVRELAARPAREGINPKTGEKITIAAKPKRKKLVFRFSKDAKNSI